MYARTKAAAERIARDLQEYGAPVVTVYPTSVQGPHDPTYGIGSQLIEEAIRSRRYLAVKGSGRGYTDVRDLAELLARCIEPGLGPRRFMAGGYFLLDDDLVKLLSNGESCMQAMEMLSYIPNKSWQADNTKILCHSNPDWTIVQLGGA